MHRATKRLLYVTVFIEIMLVGLWVRSAFYIDSMHLPEVRWQVSVFSLRGRLVVTASHPGGVPVRLVPQSEPLREDLRGWSNLRWEVSFQESRISPYRIYSVAVAYWAMMLVVCCPLAVYLMRLRFVVCGARGKGLKGGDDG